ncbi:MAG: 1,4-dihydroxy-2-naphthoyl-CoA hydrolase [Thermoleophilaceae bacterium]|nr:1,4-dihydroxy-2-naphthoyl-CoA hydrolase [Thermoleophilaceae bacterium]
MSAPNVPVFAVAPEQTLDGTLGFETLEVGEDVARARVPVTDRVRQPYGLVHGGVYAALAESLASMATAMAVYADGMIAVGLSNQTSFMRPATEGTVHAEARRRHRGRTTWVWDVDMTDDQGRLCATTRVTMAVRPQPGSAQGQ